MKEVTTLLKVPKHISECAWTKKNDHICSDDQLIVKMKKYYEEKTGNLLNIDDNSLNQNNKQKIVDNMKKILNCNSESCILLNDNFKKKNKNLINENLKKNFVVEGPAFDKNKWLSNFNIDDTLNQMKLLFDKLGNGKFLHIKFKMRDFEQYDNELNTINFIDEYKKGTKMVGVIFNTDVYSGNGKHWYAVFFDFRKSPFTLEYFDSAANSPISETHKWLIKTKYKLQQQIDIPINFINVSKVHHQTDGSSCGVYSLYYIYLRARGIPYTYFLENRIPDNLMYLFRKYLFRHA